MKNCERHIMHQSNRLQLSLFSCLTRNKRPPGIGWSLKGDLKRLFLALSGTANDGGGGPGGGQRAARADAELAAGRGPEPRHPGVRALHPDHGQPGQHRLPGGHQGMSVPDSSFFFLHTHFGKRREGGSGNYIFWLGGLGGGDGVLCVCGIGGGGGGGGNCRSTTPFFDDIRFGKSRGIRVEGQWTTPSVLIHAVWSRGGLF